jgi:hypothetical protein
MGDTSDTIKLLHGIRFHLDLGFTRASSLDFGVMAGHRIVTSCDGGNMFLLIVCVKVCHIWVFCEPSKAPPSAFPVEECGCHVSHEIDGSIFSRHFLVDPKSILPESTTVIFIITVIIISTNEYGGGSSP